MNDAAGVEAAIRIGLVADEAVSATDALNGLPLVWGSVVLVWRCTFEEAARQARAGQLDCLAYVDSNEDGELTLHFSNLATIQSLDGLDGRPR